MGNEPDGKCLFKGKRALGKKGNVSLMCVARRMCRITWQLLTQRRCYAKVSPPKTIQGRPEGGDRIAPTGSTKEVNDHSLPAAVREPGRKRKGAASTE